MLLLENKRNFVSGTDNPDGLRLQLTFDEDTRSSFGEFICPEKFQGEVGHVHIGIIAMLLEEGMFHINRAMNFNAVTTELTVRYLQTALIGERLYIRSWFVKKNQRIIENRAEVENEIGKIVARSKGKYSEIEEDTESLNV